jgi:hypothetical protein
VIRLLHPGGRTYWLAPDETTAAELVKEAGFRYADDVPAEHMEATA